MTERQPEPAPRRTRTLCLGEALVDLICERPIGSLAEADAFVPHFGGAVANVALVAARSGAQIALAGGAGDDDWGRWLRRRLSDGGVDLSLFELIDRRQTPIAAVAVGADGDASYRIYGEQIPTVVYALGDRVEQAVELSAALFFSSNTLVGAQERAITMRARELALERGLPVVFDPNLRLHRWHGRAAPAVSAVSAAFAASDVSDVSDGSDVFGVSDGSDVSDASNASAAADADAAACANACVPGAFLVRANAAEAALMTGEPDPERAAAALLEAGARMVVITLGPGGAILRGERRVDAQGVTARVLSTVGAGDVLTGTLLGRLALSHFDPPAVAAGLRDAVAASARACERWGALE